MMDEEFDQQRDLLLERLIAASPEALYRCWTEPALLVRWFAPMPWRTLSAELDLRVGGASLVVMGGPMGRRSPVPASIWPWSRGGASSPPMPMCAPGCRRPAPS